MKFSDFAGKDFHGKKVILLNPNLVGGTTIHRQQPPLGLMTIMGALREVGILYDFIDAEGKDLTDEKVLEALDRLKPDFIGITLFTLSAKFVFPLLNRIKEMMTIPIIVGGPLPTVDAEWVMSECLAIDYCVLGEGEIILPALLYAIHEQQKLELIPNIVYRDVNKIIVSNRKALFLEGHEVPMPDFNIVDFTQYGGVTPIGAWPSTNLLVTRGCPFQCTFCSNPIWNHRPHAVPVSTVIRWLQVLAAKGIREVFFVDDTLNIDSEWFEELCAKLIFSGLNQIMTFKGPFRANLTSFAQLQRAKEAGFWLIFYGVESGSQELLDYYRKDETVIDMERAIRWTREAGLKSQASMIAGAPLDTAESLLQTANFLRNIDPDYAPIHPLIPYIGTPISQDIVKRGLLELKLIRDYDTANPLICTESLCTKELLDIICFIRDDFLKYKHSPIRRVRRAAEIKQFGGRGANSDLVIAAEEREADVAYSNGGVPVYREIIAGSPEVSLYGDSLDTNTADYRFHFEGWFALEEKCFRWMSTTVKIPFFMKNNAQILGILWNSHRNENVAIQIVLNEALVCSVFIENPGWRLDYIEFSSPIIGEAWIELRLVNPWMPKGDNRLLGMAIQKIFFTKDEESMQSTSAKGLQDAYRWYVDNSRDQIKLGNNL